MTVSVNNAFNTFTNGCFKLMNGTQLYDNFVALKNAPAIPKELRNNGYDWLKNGTQTGVVQNYTIDFRGSSQTLKPIFQETTMMKGTVKGYDFNRLSFRINHDQTVKAMADIKA